MPRRTEFQIAPVRAAADLAAVARLFEAYAASLDVDLCFQGFAAELAGLPGKYAPPAGELFLARSQDGQALGCIALHPLRSPEVCEIKRLYVAPTARGMGLGRALLDRVLRTAREIGYREVWLDTLPGMTEAMALYHGAGFRPIAPYYATPVHGTLFLGCQLAPQSDDGS
ncbi:MAG: GNAT family N-acetyltransferase [Geminicoccaceae bacterium]